MPEARRDRWEATTLGRSEDTATREDGAFDPTAPPTAGSGAVRALSLDPDRYSIGEVLGEGGMGEVRRCRDRSAGRDVALKVVRPGTDVDDIEGRFLREARVQARLDHPAVVPVYDVGHDVHGRAYFTMKRVEGVTLDDVMERLRDGDATALRDYPRHRLLTAFARACLAVDYAHARGVLHRDLKPANLMLGAFGEVYVLDWGLAKIASPEVTGELAVTAREAVPSDPGLTERGVAMGTPAYMAPEQAAALPLDARADVFSLGAILFELLALDPLLGDEEIRAARARRAFSLDARPSVRAPGRAIPPELDAICIRATASEPDDRFASARALHEAVEAFLAADEEQGRIQRLAAAHVARARALSAPEAGDGARPQALEELGAALALAPEDPDARAHLVHLLRSPPKETPPEVRARRTQQDVARLRRMQRVVAAIYFVGWLVGYPIIVVAGGVRDLGRALVVPAAWLVTGAVILALHWLRKHDTRVSWTAVTASAAIALTSLVWGPLFIVPSLTVAVVYGQLLVAPKGHRPHIVVLKSLALAVPAYLSFRGLLDVYTADDAGAILVHGAVGTSRSVFYAGLTMCHLATIAFGARFAARYRDVLDARVLENALFSWQLANLVPSANGATRPRSSVIVSDGDDAHARVRGSIPPPLPDRDGGITGDGRYTRVDLVDSTGDAEVWRCHDRRLDREVELHLARSSDGDEIVRARARVRARLEHPAIAPLYDVGLTSDGRAFFTAKLVLGTPLDVALAALTGAPAVARERARRRLLTALGQVCLAVAYAHERGVAHGALSTSSIVLGSFGEVYVEGFRASAAGARQSRSEAVVLLPTEAAELDVWRLGEVLRAVLDAFATASPELDAISARATTLGASAPSARAINEAIESFLSGDRDAEVRRDLAREHLARAHAAAARAFGRREAFEVQADARVVALREVGRAVRLHPEEPAATQLLFRLITEPPPEPPPVVLNEVERLRQERGRGSALAALLFGGLWLLLFPVVAMLIGVKHLVPVVVIWLSWALAEAAMLHSILRRKPVRVPWPMLATMFAAMMTAALSGPFFATPVIATLATMSFVLVVARGWRYVTIALGSFVVLVPAILAWLRVFPSMDIVDDVILPDGALEAPSFATTLLVLTVFHLLAVLFSAEYAARFRDRLDAVENAFLLRTWQLTKLLPQRGRRS
ncbi:MAG: protein kinase [Labilithrix sp.]|nr:protein kinase [Labilithrix sp.]